MNTPWSRVAVDALCAAGVRDLVVSPGSRSTPLVLAALESSLDVHVIVDERSAAFFALGRARVTAVPVALLCTSGTAGAHYLPALLEAAYARVPLVAITADRPAELHGCAAPQTIDQRALFASCARVIVELGAPESSPASLRGLRRRVLGAVSSSQWPEPGPVHINAPFRKPLEPTGRDDDDASRATLAEPAPRFFAPTLAATDAATAELRAAITASRRGVIVAGPAPLATDREAAFALARATGFPLYAEATSQLRFGARDATPVCDALGTIARADVDRRLAPDLVIQLGAPPITGALEGWASAARRVVVAEHGWPDPSSTAVILGGPVGDLCRRAAAGLVAPPPSAWSSALARADRAAWNAVETELSAHNSEAAAVRAAIAALPDGALAVLGNSLPVRSVDSFVPGSAARIGVLHQRGASGIDGLISGSAGAALGTRPVALLLGDVSFAHDLGGLAATRHARAPLAIIVLDNAGGRIFDELPVAALAQLGDDFARAWRTPPGLDIASACRAAGVGYQSTTTATELGAAVGEALRRAATTVIHATVEPESARAARARVDAAVAEAIACASGDRFG